MERAVHAEIEHYDNVGYVACCDVAMGVGRDSCVMSIYRVSGYSAKDKIAEQVELCIRPADTDPEDFAYWVNSYLLEREDLYPNITISVDAVGSGYQTVKRLEALGNFTIVPINWGKPCWSKKERERFGNERAFANVMARDGIKEGRLKLKDNARLLEEGSKIPYRFKETGQYMMHKKEEMAAKGIPSPDCFDTVSFLYLTDHVPANDNYGNDDEGAETEVDEIFAELAS